MRSVSIVYKKARHQSYTQLPKRRSVDNYYSSLMDRQKIKEQILTQRRQLLEKRNLRTANSQRIRDQYNILGTLSIAPLVVHRQTPQINDDKISLLTQRKLSIQPQKIMLRGLLMPRNYQPQYQQQQMQRGAHCKLKLVFKEKRKQLLENVVVMTANLIINESYFWGQEQIDEQAIKHWRVLQNYAHIVWICHRQETCKKIVKFSKNFRLKTDFVYLIVPKKNKRLLTVSYQPVQRQFDFKPLPSSPNSKSAVQRMVVFCGLLVENMRQLDAQCFYETVPMLTNYQTIVHFTKADPNDKGRLGQIMRILSQEKMPIPFDIGGILNDYIEENGDWVCTCEGEQVKRQNLMEKIQQMKASFINYFGTTLSKKMNELVSHDDKQNSAQFIIGDMLRRNYKIMQNYYDFYYQYTKNQTKVCRCRPLGTRKQSRYRTQVYV